MMSSRARMGVRTTCAATPTPKPKFDIKDAIEKRKHIDRKRAERVKEIGKTLDHIARSEVSGAAETLNEVFPFVEKLKDFKGITKDDIERFFDQQKGKWASKPTATDE
jgi:hypothetical protein